MCGSDLPYPYVTSSHNVTLVFVSDGIKEDTGIVLAVKKTDGNKSKG